ncbi:MAG TPA: serine protease [Pseudolabrys sp.]
MRLVTTLLLLSLLLGAAARADDTPSIMKWFTPAEEKPAAPAATTPAKPKAAPKAATATATPVKLPVPKPEIAKTEAAKLEPTKGEPAKPELAKVEPAKAAPAKITPPKIETSSDTFASIPAAERQKVQAALLWAGDFSGDVKGEDPLVAAVKNYQKRSKIKITGVLTDAERASLIAATNNREQEFGWSVVIDPATGSRIGLPIKMMPHARDTARGTRWSSTHGDVQVETFRVADRNLKLSALFEQEKRDPATRKIEYSLLRDDGFFISGFQGLKKFSVKATFRDGEVRGFTMLYDQMMETIVTPVMVAMSASFSPFPDRSAPFATLTKSVEYGNGLVVSADGYIITDRKLIDGCQVLVASGIGDVVRVAEDKDNGLALLRVYGPRKLSPLSLPQDAPKMGDLTLFGIPDPKEDGSRKLTEIKARLVNGTAIELRQPVPMAGFAGAAALDGQGRFLGMMEMRNAVLASIEPSAPPVQLVTAQTIRGFLAKQNVAANDTPGTDAKAAVVRMICVRK